MDVSRDDFVGVWQGDHHGGRARHRIEMHLQGMRLAGTWTAFGIEPSGLVTKAFEVQIREESLRGDTIILANAEQGGRMQIQLVNCTEIVLGPPTDAASTLDLNDPRIIHAIEMHKTRLFKQDIVEQQAAA